MSNTTEPWATYTNSGDQAWQLIAGTLVCLQSIPGMIIMYAGLSKAKWAINSAFMGLYAFSITLVIWVLYAYNMAFGKEWFPLCGVPSPVLGMRTALNQSGIPALGTKQNFNLATLVFFQFAFAAITIIIIAGALLGRMNVMAWAIFVPLWITFSYCPVAFSLWGGGFLERLGVIDYAGGFAIHVSSGTAGFIAAAIVGPRHKVDLKDHRPSNLGFCVIGAGIVWCGWTGFNGGAPLSASADAGIAVLNTYVCAAAAILSWTVCDAFYYKRAAILGCVQGMICGLVAITPCAGLVAGWAAVLIGIISAIIPWLTMNLLGRMRPLCYVDDTLGVIHTHTVAGLLGGFLVGCFAERDGSRAFALDHAGAITGNGRQVWVQLVGFLFTVGWNMVWTPLILFVIRAVFRVPLRAPDDILIVGDDAIHGEEAYSLSMPMPMNDFDRRSTIEVQDPYRRMSHDNLPSSGPPTLRGDPSTHAIAMSDLQEVGMRPV